MITIESEGLTEVIRSFSPDGVGIEQSLLEAMHVMTEFIEGQGQLQMPVKTGQARDSWIGDVTDHGDIVISTFEGIFYIPRLDAGYSSQAPDGFLTGIIEFGIDEILPDALFEAIARNLGQQSPAGNLVPQFTR